MEYPRVYGERQEHMPGWEEGKKCRPDKYHRMHFGKTTHQKGGSSPPRFLRAAREMVFLMADSQHNPGGLLNGSLLQSERGWRT